MRDQTLRSAYEGYWRNNLPPGAAAQWAHWVTGQTAAEDCANAAWVETQLRRIEWFDIATYGARGDQAAWLIIQHADRRPQLQRAVLAKLEALPPGRTSGRNLAYLSDRIAVADGRPQRYGTQMQCENGSWMPRVGLVDAANIEATRAAAGLPTLDQYRAMMSSNFSCPPA